MELSVGAGAGLVPTVDISATDCGTVRLVHEDIAQLEQDYATAVGLMPTMFIVGDDDLDPGQ